VRLREYARRAPGRPLLQAIWWDLASFLCEAFVHVLYRLQIRGRENIPRSGPVLFISNHQSFYDPIINGTSATDRPFAIIARATLFRFKPFSWLIRSFGALPVSGEAGDAGTMRILLEELAAGRTALVYPEGTRSADGALLPFQKGVLLLIRRARVPVIPIGIDGAIDVWPRGASRPHLWGHVATALGAPIDPAVFDELAPAAALALLEERVDALRLEARAMIRERTRGRWPRPGPGDVPLTAKAALR
jgi:1-acyl-sn-glycerol-3-phosphate acyltransferase